MFVVALTSLQTPSPTTPAWVAVLGTASAMITAVGIIIAGIFAYFKLVKGRTLHPRFLIDIDPRLVEAGEGRALRISVTARNEGQTALLVLSDVQQQLLVSQADNRIWRQACECGQPVRWEESEFPLIEWNLAYPEREALDRLLDELKEAQAEEEHDTPWWRQLNRAELLKQLDGDKLEPGEQWARSTLVPVESDSVAYLVCVQVKACRHVAVRHVIRHRRRCCDTKSSHLTWQREIYVLPGGKR